MAKADYKHEVLWLYVKLNLEIDAMVIAKMTLQLIHDFSLLRVSFYLVKKEKHSHWKASDYPYAKGIGDIFAWITTV